MKRIERLLKRFYLDGRIWWHYGTLRPERVQLVDSDRHVYVNPLDPRGRKRLIADSMRNRYPRNQRFWRTAMAELDPNTILDVGLNYGECLFSTRLPSHAKAFGFEANPKLRPWIESSQGEHPDADRMEVIYQLVGNGELGTHDFYIDKQWSGSSRAGYPAGPSYDSNRYELVAVSQCSIDQVLRDRQLPVGTLLFKIDVEGFEYQVLQGMGQTLADAKLFVGFVEFDGQCLQQAGESVADYWDFLRRNFAVYSFTKRERWFRADVLELDEFASRCGRHFHTDIVISRPGDNSVVETILQSWEADKVEATIRLRRCA